jgi:hypothetical protein
MAVGGLDAQIGYALESTVGTPVTVTAFVPLVSESLMQERARLESAGIIAGKRVLNSNQWNGGDVTVSGSVQHELYNRGLGKLFTAMFGAVSTTGAGPYVHTFTPGDLTGDALTVQVGRPGIDGTVYPFTYAGMKVSSWEIACSAGEIATLGMDLVGIREIDVRTVSDGVTTSGSAAISSASAVFSQEDVGKPISGTGIPSAATIAAVTSATAATLSANATASGTSIAFTIGVALATASYPASIKPLKFNHAAISIGGSSAPVKSLTISGNNTIDDARRFLGSQNISEPREIGLREYTGNLEVEFTDMDLYRRYARGDEFALVANFTSGADSVVITTNVRFDGSTPQVGGRELLTQSIDFKCVSTGADSTAMSVALTNSDATP